MSFVPYIGTCVCGRRCYLTKSEAKTAIRQVRGRKGRLDAERCDQDDRYWHIFRATRGETA